jgi:hypothetical protein
LRLTQTTEECVQYQALLGEPERQWRGELTIDVTSGKVTWGDTTTETPPEWLHGFAEALVRTAWRARDSQAWPRRITRWRTAKETP